MMLDQQLLDISLGFRRRLLFGMIWLCKDIGRLFFSGMLV
jgi:hypothetical protein